MQDPLYSHLREANWRRKLTPAEEAELRAWLAAHPELEADWEAEAALTEALSRLPEPAVSTNFTARVLSKANASQESRVDSPPLAARWKSAWRSFLPKAAVAMMVMSLGGYAYHRHQSAQRAELARNIAAVSRVAAVPDPELWKDFETIRRLDRTPAPDEQLLALLR